MSLAGVLALAASAAGAPTGQTGDFAMPTASSAPEGIVAGPDGDLWFTEFAAGKVAEIDPVTHSISEFSTPTAASGPLGITVGPEGDLWFTEFAASKVAEINPITRSISEFPTPTAASGPVGIVAGPEGNLWFTEDAASKVAEINPVTHAITEFSTPTASAGPVGISPGSDGNVWFTENGVAKIGFTGTGAPAASLQSLGISGAPQPGSQLTCQGALWASWAGLEPSPGAFGFDGYQWLRDASPITDALEQTYVPSAADLGHQLSCKETVTYPLLSVTTSATSAPVSVTAPLGVTHVPGIGVPAAPRITAFHESASIWREDGTHAQISRRDPIGSIFSFTLNEPASVSLTFTQRRAGRKIARKCLTATPRNSKHRTCQRTVTAGGISVAAHRATNKIFFGGRISKTKRLKPGRYTVNIIAINASGARSKSVSLNFTIVK